jgi:DNA repair exonuclease SbcCD ATPase subunit
MFSAQKGTEDYLDAYRKLGVEFTNMDGSLRNSDSVYWEVIDSLGQMANETERDATAMLLLGKSAQDLNPLIKIGSGGVAEFAKEARNMGAVLSNETLAKLGETDDALQRLYQQIEISKRSIGSDIAPDITKAFDTIANKIDESDDKIADFAKDAIGPMVDGFIWIVDNADTISAAIKGITAGMITKKAVDGISLAIGAYGKLTEATKAATVAQTAFNVASKANIIGAIAGVIIGAGTAIYSYAKSVGEASEETNKLNDESKKLKDAYEEINDTIQNNVRNREKSLSTIEDEGNATLKLIDSLYDLSEEENKSNVTKQQMVSLVEQINKAIPEMNLSIDEQTGLLNKQRGEVEKLVQAHIELSTVEALKGNLSTIALDKYNQEKALNVLLEERKVLDNELLELKEKYDSASNLPTYKESFEKEKINQKIRELNKEIKENEEDVTKATKAIEEFGKSYEEALGYIGNHSDLSSATRTLDNFLVKYKQVLDAQNKEYAAGLDNRVDAIEDSYKASAKALDKSQKAEKKALDKAHKEQIEAVEDATDKELKILETKHKKKLKLIDEEYLEKMKLVNEDRYNEIKNVQDQIDSIDAQTEAEDRAIAKREEAEKRAELILQIEAAKTAEERLDAQKALTDFEEKTASDRLKTERGLQKDILEEQKDTINKKYDTEIEKLEEKQKKDEEAAKTAYEAETLAITDRLERKKEELGDIQELETEALADRQEAARLAVSDQKENEIKSAKETYDEDLRLFKLNNALKYDAAVDNHEEIKKYISQHPISSSGSFTEAQQSFVKTNIWDPDYIFGNKFRLEQNTSQVSIDYGRMEDAFVSSLKNMNLEVILDGKKVGLIIEKKVNGMLR